MKKLDALTYLIAGLVLVAAGFCLFYSTAGDPFPVVSIYGERVELYGDGIYAYNTVLKAAANKGTDATMVLVAILFIISTVKSKKRNKHTFYQLGFLTGLLYYASFLVFGVTFNQLFPVYLLLFSATLFTFIFLLSALIRNNNLSNMLQAVTLKGTAIFIIISGCSALVWLQFIIPALISGEPLAHMEIYTTEPTFVLDLAIILPTYLGCGIAMLNQKQIGYKLAPILLVFIIIVGLTVISQTIFQTAMGIIIPVNEMVGLVFSFVLLGLIAFILNVRFAKYLK